MSVVAIASSGQTLVDALAIAAREREVPLRAFVAPLTSDPRKWLRQLAQATTPKPATVARVEALIAGRALPRPANHLQAGRPGAPRRAPIFAVRQADPVPPTAPVFRDPCFRCGARGDLGCGCR